MAVFAASVRLSDIVEKVEYWLETAVSVATMAIVRAMPDRAG